MSVQTSENAGSMSTDIQSFYRCLQHEMTHADASHVLALLVISFRRSDRISSILGEQSALDTNRDLVTRVRSVMRTADKFVLIRNDECWLLLPKLRTESLALLAVHRIVEVLEPPFQSNGHAMFMRPSIGIACAPQHAQSAEMLLQAADLAQQAARSRNVAYVMSDANGDKNALPDNVESAIHRVLASNALTVVYQPKIDLLSGRAASVEALVRWPENDSHLVSTLSLVETAERSGLIEALTMHVLNTVLRERKTWLQQGVDIKIWVNVSAKLLTQKHLPQLLQQLLQVWNATPAAIGLEITESALIYDIEQTTEILYELKQLGFSLTIDDFGTGYSSLAYLRRFPISELKIDKMFVQGMAHSQSDYQIVKSIIDLAHNFGLQVVAEGPENQETALELRKLQCDMAQGFFYATPMNAEALLAWWQQFNAAEVTRD